MNSLERVTAAVKFQETDRTPVIAQVFGHAGTISGVPVDDYVRDGDLLAECQLSALKRYQYDAVFTVMDVNIETEAVGSVLKYRRNQYPTVEQPVLGIESDLSGLSIPDPKKAGRMPEMLKALGVLSREVGRETLVVGCVAGPFTLTTQLLGIENALFMAVDDSERLEQVMDFATQVLIHFGLAQIEAGAHLPIVFDPSASPAVIPPKFFRELELPRLRKLFQAFASAGAAANWLHIAGPTAPILAMYPKAEVDIANFDYCVEPEEVGRQLPNTCVDGNIRSVAFIESRPEEIGAAAVNLLRTFRARRGFILSSGCEIPPESAPENVTALVEAAYRGS